MQEAALGPDPDGDEELSPRQPPPPAGAAGRPRRRTRRPVRVSEDEGDEEEEETRAAYEAALAAEEAAGEEEEEEEEDEEEEEEEEEEEGLEVEYEDASGPERGGSGRSGRSGRSGGSGGAGRARYNGGGARARRGPTRARRPQPLGADPLFSFTAPGGAWIRSERALSASWLALVRLEATCCGAVHDLAHRRGSGGPVPCALGGSPLATDLADPPARACCRRRGHRAAAPEPAVCARAGQMTWWWRPSSACRARPGRTPTTSCSGSRCVRVPQHALQPPCPKSCSMSAGRSLSATLHLNSSSVEHMGMRRRPRPPCGAW